MNVGDTIGNYRILGELGRGGMGVVFKAEQINLGRFVALKALYPHLCSDPVTVMRFNREARTTALLNHPNVVQVYDIGQHEDVHYFSMEFVPGRTLAQILKQRGALPVQEVLRITDQIAAGLAAGHGVGLIHRDIKPSNIIVTDDGRVKVTDFGIALVAGQGELTDTGHLVGTARYMAPEQAKGDDLDVRSDLYSLGVVLFEMLVGRPPFQADDPLALLTMHLNDPVPDLHQLVPGIPRSLALLTGKLLEKLPADRFRNVRQLRAELRQVAGEIQWNGPGLPPLEPSADAADVDPGFAFDAAGPLRQTTDTVTLFIVNKVRPDSRLFGGLRRAMERFAAARLTGRRDSYKLQKLEVAQLRDQFQQASRQLDTVKEECDRVYKKWEETDKQLHGWQMKGSLAIREYNKFEAEDAAEEEKHHWRRATAYKLQWHSLQEQVRDWYTNVERARQDYERARHDLEALSRQRKIVSDRSGVTRRNRVLATLFALVILTAVVLIIHHVWAGVPQGPSDFRKVATLNAPRDESAAARLPDGRVLVVGGLNRTERKVLDAAEVYDPVARVFTPVSPMNQPRFNHTLDTLPDGTVLVLGGESQSFSEARDALRSAEEFSPKENRFVQTGTLHVARTRHRSLVLPDGRLLVVGGRGASGEDLAAVELFDPQSHRFTDAGTLVTARKDHTLTLLPDGRVLVVGGSQDAATPLDSVELYDPRTGLSSEIVRLHKPRYEHTATLLPDGKVLVVAGRQSQDPSDMLRDTELIDPAARTSRPGPQLTWKRKVHAATVTAWNGEPGVLVVGGGSDPGSEQCEFYDFELGRFLPGPKLNYNRNNHLAVTLADGSLLVLGGFGTDARTPLQTAELFTPAPATP